MSGKPNKPRIPALVRHEVEGKEQKNQVQDDARMSYRGYEKSKLHSSRKIQRKMLREQKKRHKQEHQMQRSSAADKLKKLEEENRLLKQKLAAQKKNPSQKESKPSPKSTASRNSTEKSTENQSKKPKGPRDHEVSEPKPKRLKVLQFSKDFSADVSKAGPDNSSFVREQERLEAMKRANEEDEKLIQELQGKLGGGWRKELEEEVCPRPVRVLRLICDCFLLSGTCRLLRLA